MSLIESIREQRATILQEEEERELGRVRGRQKGHLRRKGNSWVLTYREYFKDDAGEWADRMLSKAVCASSCTRKQAEKEAAPYLAIANRAAVKPSIAMTVDEFIEKRFEPQVTRTKKPSGVKHYRYLIGKFISPAIGHQRLCDVGPDQIEQLITRLDKTGYANQTLKHVVGAVRRIFNVADKLELYDRRNPATHIEVGEVVHEKRATFSAEQAVQVLCRLKSPIYEMAMLSIETSMGPSELCGIRLLHCNLTEQVRESGGEVMAPCSIAIRENWYEGQRGTLKTGARLRNVPITAVLAATLRDLVIKLPRQDDDAPLFQPISRKALPGRKPSGRPVDPHNVSNRLFKKLSKELDFPVTWYAFRRCHSSLAAITGADLTDRSLVMGHGNDRMTRYYDIASVERMRAVPERITGHLLALMKVAGGVN